MITREMIVLGDEVVDAAVGNRCWRYRAEAGVVTLRSLTDVSLVWPHDDPLEAEPCECGDDGCVCGIYAWAPNHERYPWSIRFVAGDVFIYGSVHLWGEVDIHERGLRGTVARPAAFYVHAEMQARYRLVVELAAAQYGVPLVAR